MLLIRLWSLPPPITTETWVIKSSVDDSYNLTNTIFEIPFSSAGIEFSKIVFYIVKTSMLAIIQYYDKQGNAVDVFVNGMGFDNEAYRTLVFSEQPTGDLLTWLQANATKQ